jgi:hypothetical protein
MSALALPLEDPVADPSLNPALDPAGVVVRVLDAQVTESGGLSVTLAVADTDATRIARLGATDQLVLIGLPAPQPAATPAAATP